MTHERKYRIGQGLDIHPFSVAPERAFILGGVKIEGVRGLAGHSDADALSHAICDALLGAANLGDIGQHFSDRDPKNAGRSSLDFLTAVKDMLAAKHWRIENIDSTVLTESPMLAPHLNHMRNNIATALGIDDGDISIKATRPEQLGALGRKEGLLVLANALISRDT